jgi:diguanylate cyclase (GGDEF)-like protein/PAS domain S-box-containing protein
MSPVKTKKTAKRVAPKPADSAKLRRENNALKEKLEKISMEKNFLERAMGDLNFHNNAHDGVVYTNADNEITYANPYFMGMMGIKAKTEIIDKEFPDYMWNNATEAERLFRDIKNDGFVREREMALYNREGQAVFAMCSGVASKDDEGNIIGTEIMFCNITSKRKFQVELVEQNALLDGILQSTPDPILVLNSALDLQRSNEAANILFGIQAGQKVNLTELLSGKSLPTEVIHKIESRFLGEQHFDLEIAISEQHFELHAAPLKSSQKGWVCVLHNITARKLTQEMLQHHAFHDALTQLPNRSYFIDHLQRANLLSRTDPNYKYAVLFVDLDGLKSFNDNFGHHVGDELLYSFARRLEASIRPGDLVARLAGDEFALFLDRIGEISHAEQIATRVRDSLLRPYTLNSHEGQVNSTASIGIALSAADTSAEDLIRKADKAMYEVKQRGGNGFEVFAEKVSV